MLDVRDANGVTVVVPIELNARKDLTAVVYMATSAYSRDSNGVPNNAWFARQAKENALYINRKKKSAGLKPPPGPIPFGSNPTLQRIMNYPPEKDY